jgi:hypothetical protein
VWRYVGLLLALWAGLAGCTGKDPAPAPPPGAVGEERLPAEVAGDPGSALPKPKAAPRRHR